MTKSPRDLAEGVPKVEERERAVDREQHQGMMKLQAKSVGKRKANLMTRPPAACHPPCQRFQHRAKNKLTTQRLGKQTGKIIGSRNGVKVGTTSPGEVRPRHGMPMLGGMGIAILAS